MKYLLSAVGTFGDVAPFVAVGVALQQRGHKVMLAVNPFFSPMVTEAGLLCQPVETWRDVLSLTTQPRLTLGPLALPRVLRGIVVPALGTRYRELKDVMADWRPDFVFSQFLALDATWAATEMGVPWAVGLLAPVAVLSAEDLSYFPGTLNLTQSWPWLKRYGKWRLGLAARLLADGPVNRVRRELGLSSQTGALLERIHDGRATLGLWSRHYRPPASDDPSELRICGFPWFEWDAPADSCEDVLRFLDEGEAPVVFALGTGQFQVAGNFLEIAAQSCARIGRRGLVLTTSGHTAPNLSPDVRCFPRAPFSLVLSRASATVHHGGIGTTARVMRAGCPSVVVPFAHDQFDNGLRVARLGLGRTLSRRKMTGASLAATLESVLNDAPMRARCQAMKEKLHAEDGATEAAQILDRLAPGT